tara:strand:+ start:454 stop:777 length:324 start_codon:yes stop_codon:yes gene_type:complete
MKKIILLAFLTIFSLNSFAQNNLIKKATKITNEMTKVLSLNKEEKSKVYEIQLKRFQDVVLIRDEYQDNPEIRKAELKKVYKRLFGKLKNALGKDKMQEWKIYKQNN